MLEADQRPEDTGRGVHDAECPAGGEHGELGGVEMALPVHTQRARGAHHQQAVVDLVAVKLEEPDDQGRPYPRGHFLEPLAGDTVRGFCQLAAACGQQVQVVAGGGQLRCDDEVHPGAVLLDELDETVDVHGDLPGLRGHLQDRNLHPVRRQPFVGARHHSS